MYRGPWTMSGGAGPAWPPGNGKRVYAYLAPCPELPRILDLLVGTDCRWVISAGRLDPGLQQPFAGERPF